jgi:hypothetical protein
MVMHFQRLALIGCGLIGGSFALGLKAQQRVSQVVGFSASEASKDKGLHHPHFAAEPLRMLQATCKISQPPRQFCELTVTAHRSFQPFSRAVLCDAY